MSQPYGMAWNWFEVTLTFPVCSRDFQGRQLRTTFYASSDIIWLSVLMLLTATYFLLYWEWHKTSLPTFLIQVRVMWVDDLGKSMSDPG